ncbi:unnamed protein product, partial [Brachionus calyciflorus]
MKVHNDLVKQQIKKRNAKGFRLKKIYELVNLVNTSSRDYSYNFVNQIKFRSKIEKSKFDKRQTVKITAAILLAIRILTLRSRGMFSARETAFKINKMFDIRISRRTVSEKRNQMGFHLRKPKSAPILTAKNKEIRLNFAKKNLNENHENFIFVDETSVWTFSNRSLQCRPKDCIPQANSYSKKAKLNLHVWAGISFRGVTDLVIFTNNLNRFGYKQLIKNHLIPFIQTRYKNRKIKLIQDNDSKHTSKLCKNLFQESEIDWKLAIIFHYTPPHAHPHAPPHPHSPPHPHAHPHAHPQKLQNRCHHSHDKFCSLHDSIIVWKETSYHSCHLYEIGTESFVIHLNARNSDVLVALPNMAFQDIKSEKICNLNTMYTSEGVYLSLTKNKDVDFVSHTEAVEVNFPIHQEFSNDSIELCFRDQPGTYTIDKEIKKGFLINDGIIKPNSEVLLCENVTSSIQLPNKEITIHRKNDKTYIFNNKDLRFMDIKLLNFKLHNDNFSHNKILTEEMDLISTFQEVMNHEISAGSWYNHVTDTVEIK